MQERPETRQKTEQTSWDTLEQLYFQGLSLSGDERAELLIPLAGQPELISELEAMWRHQIHNGNLFDVLPGISRSFWHGFAGEAPPQNFGPYQVGEELGRGGMGIVYKAHHPELSREVAVKVLPSTLNTQSWRSRFQVEQQTLSALNHPNIATIHDGGTTAENQPYLVMELLEGLPITQYCDERKLAIHARLALFIQVCQGMAHAHRKGVIHRDLKSSNVMVVQQDRQAIPKIIDFGIAHSPDHQTSLPQAALGTPSYMSPEQASGKPGARDTRSDIYSLGALLFQLLTGETPLQHVLKEEMDFSEKCRVIMGNPVPPLATLVDGLITSERAAARSTQPKILSDKLKGELNWIVNKALAAKPEDRYSFCDQLADDLIAFQQNRPVSAAPPGGGYLARKWLSNHKLAVTAAILLTASLLIGLITSLAFLHKAQASERNLLDIHEFSRSIFQGMDPYFEGRNVRVIDLLDKKTEEIEKFYADRPLMESQIRQVLADAYCELGLYERADPQFARIYELASLDRPPWDEAALEALGKRAYNFFQAGSFEKARRLYEEAGSKAVTKYGPKHPLYLWIRSGYADVLSSLGETARAGAIFEETLDLQWVNPGPHHRETLATLNNFARFLVDHGKNETARIRLTQALEVYQTQTRRQDPFLASVIHNLALACFRQNLLVKASDLADQALKIRKDLLGQHHPNTLKSFNLLASIIGHDNPARAVELLEKEILALPDQALDSAVYLRLRHNLGHFLKESKDLEKAETILRDTWTKREKLLGPGAIETLKTHYTLGEVLCLMGKHPKCLEIYKKVVEQVEASLGRDHPTYQLFYGYWTAEVEEHH